MVKKLFFGASVCALIAVVAFIQKGVAANEEVLTLGTMSGWPPFVSLNTKGEYEGFDIEIAQEIARRLGKKLVIKDMDTAALITALEKGTVDFIMTGLDITSQRLKRIAMISYQGEPMTEMPLIFWKKVPEGIKSFDDLKNRKAVVCVEPGSSQEEMIKKLGDVELKYCDPLASILELKFGRALAAISEKKLFLNLKKQYPELVAIMIPINKEDQIMGCGIGVQKNNTELYEKISMIISDLKKTGYLGQAEQRWFVKDQS